MFTNYEKKESSFKRTISVRDWANEVKTAQNVASLNITNILSGKEDAKYVIATLANGKSATLPVSKKATIGAPITDYKMAENNDGQWVVVTGSGAESTDF